jgi:hypothetical protein
MSPSARNGLLIGDAYILNINVRLKTAIILIVDDKRTLFLISNIQIFLLQTEIFIDFDSPTLV